MVVFQVVTVEAPRPADGFGQCIVSGKVEKVERGTHYRLHGRIRVEVPCIWPHAEMRTGGVIWQTPASLKASKRARAWMDQPGELALYQYEILPAA